MASYKKEARKNHEWKGLARREAFVFHTVALFFCWPVVFDSSMDVITKACV